MGNKKDEVGYQFNAVPMNLMACCDLNCRSMLWTLVQLSSYYADKDGWFFRTNEDLRVQSRLSENLVRATLSTFYRVGIVEVQTVGKGKSKTPNKFRLNVERFKDWEQYSLEDCIKHPDLRIETDGYKTTGWQASYLTQQDNEPISDTVTVPISSPKPQQCEDNIENTDNKENKLSEGYKQVEAKSNEFDRYKQRENYLMDRLYNVTTWTDFKLIRKQINELPYNSFYDEFYREYDCGWLGKDNKQNITQPQHTKEEVEDPNADLREIFRINGWGEPDIVKYDKQKQEGQDFSPIDDDNLPF